MPWCPNCKTEYREGVKVCSDCGAKLIDEIKNEEKTDFVQLAYVKKEEAAQKFVSYMEYSKIKAKYEYDEEEDSYFILVPEKDSKKAAVEFRAFSQVETERILEDKRQYYESMLAEGLEKEEAFKQYRQKQEDKKAKKKENKKKYANILNYDKASKDTDAEDNTDFEEETDIDEVTDIDEATDINEATDIDEENGIDEETANLTIILDEDGNPLDEEEKERIMKEAGRKSAGVYVKKADTAKDMSSTAVTFFVFAAAILVFAALNMFGIIPYFTHNIPGLVLLFAFSIGCAIVAINAHKRAKQASEDSVAEEAFTSQINDWMEKNIEIMTSIAASEGENSDELLYMSRTAAMKEAITKAFGELDEAYVDSLIDEFYDKKF